MKAAASGATVRSQLQQQQQQWQQQPHLGCRAQHTQKLTTAAAMRELPSSPDLPVG
jgi:hypothetical protein